MVLCEDCKGVEDALPEHEKRYAGRALECEKCEDIPKPIKEEEESEEKMESEFFDTRQAFLSLCQGNHFQFDSLRRAKHTTMMVLYHLNNPSEPAFVASCNVCSRELEPGKGWRCETCPISGTIRRGRDALEDAERIKQILSDKKEESELTM